MNKLQLPTVTLVAVTSVNLEATCAALARCLDQVEFADCLFMTHENELGSQLPNGVRQVPIEPIHSAAEYSEFLLRRLADKVTTDHVLVIQWDGFILDAKAWHDRFLDFDFIGASWPQFNDDHQVGNGGFSLRSRRLLLACQDDSFLAGHPEDIAICRTNRHFLEQKHGIRFADLETARHFSYEREPRRGSTFGFHGVFNLADTVGADAFWRVYETLDEPHSVYVDFATIWKELRKGRQRWRRRARLTADYLARHWHRSGHRAQP